MPVGKLSKRYYEGGNEMVRKYAATSLGKRFIGTPAQEDLMGGAYCAEGLDFGDVFSLTYVPVTARGVAERLGEDEEEMERRLEALVRTGLVKYVRE